MPKEEIINITIGENGEISADTRGFNGETCLSGLEKILDGIVDLKEVKKTDEYFQQTKQNQTTILKVGR